MARITLCKLRDGCTYCRCFGDDECLDFAKSEFMIKDIDTLISKLTYMRWEVSALENRAKIEACREEEQ